MPVPGHCESHDDKGPIDLDKPRFDQSTYWGRARHFLLLTDPRNCFVSDAELDKAKEIVTQYRETKEMPEGYDKEKLWQTKYLYDSAFHPDTGEKMIVYGRMAAQAPMNTVIIGGMITFYRSNAGVMFWQWVNQTFNALVNYTNRSGSTPISPIQLLTSYAAACGGALGTAVYLNNKAKHMSNPMFARLVPFAAVCGANFINIPMMRSNELLNGTPVYTASGEHVGDSKIAARNGIGLVCFSRIIMALPGMTLTPWITNYATRKGLFRGCSFAAIPFQVIMVGLCVTFATPLACAIFDQRAAMKMLSLESNLRDIMRKKYPDEEYVYYNKGL